jgi:hypothetical protein
MSLGKMGDDFEDVILDYLRSIESDSSRVKSGY